MVEYSVLIVDDDIWMQRILSKTLEGYGFKKAYLASNAFEGISLAVEHVPDLIILDILMPELNGHLTLKIFKQIKSTKQIPVLMVSAMSDTENLGLAVKWGTAGFISKPFTRATVYEKLISIYGKDRLDLIIKGDPIDTEFVYVSDEKAEPFAKFQEKRTVTFGEEESPDKTEAAKMPQMSVSQDQLLSHYQEDEKKSIESIKKLLMKTRK